MTDPFDPGDIARLAGSTLATGGWARLLAVVAVAIGATAACTGGDGAEGRPVSTTAANAASTTVSTTAPAPSTPATVPAGVTTAPHGTAPSDDADPELVELLALLADDRSLDGSGNNLARPLQGAAFQPLARHAAVAYADGISAVDADRPPERYLSNRVFNDTDHDLFSENGVTAWSFVWGQFIDHTVSLSDATGDEDDNPFNDIGDEGLATLPHDPDDPLEISPEALGMAFTFRSDTFDGTGAGTGIPGQQINELSSYIDAFNVYGGTTERLDWLREGVVDGDPTNNSATLLTVDGYLPTTSARDGVDAPHMDVMGRLFVDGSPTIVAGDERANEHVALTAVHTLFVREHNRIVDALPDTLDEQTKFTIARRVIAATQQYITYEEFLPAMGVVLDDYTGYHPDVDASIMNEFATVGFRAHSQIPESLIVEIPAGQVTDRLLDRFTREGVEVDASDASDDTVPLRVELPLNVVFGNPGLLVEIGLGNLAAGLANQVQQANDEQIDDQLRTVLFQIPGPQVDDPLSCSHESVIPDCFLTVNDLGALDVFRTHDHGIARYNDLRAAFGLERIATFAELTGEDTDRLPRGLSIDDPEILDVVAELDDDGEPVAVGADDRTPVTAVRRSTLAARLAAIFGSVDEVDAFTGMVSEPHVPGTEFGELQLAIWTHQFTALRDGDRFFYGNDPALDLIADLFGIDYRRSLADVIADNTELERGDLPVSVFVLDHP